MIKKIYLAGDHAGYKLKEALKPWIAKQGLGILDFGPYEYNKNDDYPDFVIPMAKQLAKDKNSAGIVIAGSGQGEAIAANKVRGIRAGLYHGGSTKIVKTGRGHDNTNILCFGSRFVSEQEAKKAIKLFLTTKFEKGRHTRRLNKISQITKR